ncbi:MAG: site-specific integrase [Actinomycetota bacterium]|nr:site-specific integrase [Actinomycetota bacterium]
MTLPDGPINAELAAALAEVTRLLAAAPQPAEAISVRDYLAAVLDAATPGTRKTYETYWHRLVKAHGDVPVPDVTTSQCAALARAAKANAVCRSNGRGGSSAEENCIGALRAFFRLAVADKLRTDNPALAVRKPNHRRALTGPEQAELWAVTTNGGDDVLLDALLHRFHLETGARRGGALSLRLCDLDDDNQLVLLREKGDTERWQPVSFTLLTALREHASARGGAGARDAVLRYKPKRGETVGAPLTRRRYNTLTVRWQKALPWAARLGVSPHWLRHTAITAVERAAGHGVARAFAGHALPGGNATTTTYIKASSSEVAAVVAVLTGEPHPLAEPEHMAGYQVVEEA